MKIIKMNIVLSYYLLIVHVCSYKVFARVIGEASTGMRQVACQNIVRQGELRLNNMCLSNTLSKTDCTGSTDQEFLICSDDQTVRQVKENQCITRQNHGIVLRKCSLATLDENQRWEKEDKSEADAGTLIWKIGGVKQNNFVLKQGEYCMANESGAATGNVLVKTCGSTALPIDAFRFNNRGTTRNQGKIKYQGNSKCITAGTGKLSTVSFNFSFLKAVFQSLMICLYT